MQLLNSVDGQKEAIGNTKIKECGFCLNMSLLNRQWAREDLALGCRLMITYCRIKELVLKYKGKTSLVA